MAQNVTITSGANSTPPDGTIIATDHVNEATHYQVVKLADGTLNSGTPIPGGTEGLFVQGAIDHDTADTATYNPLKIGARGIAHSANPTAVTANDITQLYANRHGILFTIGGHPNIIRVASAYLASVLTDNNANLNFIANAAGTKIVVTQLCLFVDEAVTVGFGATVYFGDAAPAASVGILLEHHGVVPGGGVVIGDGAGILGIGADGEDVRLQATPATTGQIALCASYFTIES